MSVQHLRCDDDDDDSHLLPCGRMGMRQSGQPCMYVCYRGEASYIIVEIWGVSRWSNPLCLYVWVVVWVYVAMVAGLCSHLFNKGFCSFPDPSLLLPFLIPLVYLVLLECPHSSDEHCEFVYAFDCSHESPWV